MSEVKKRHQRQITNRTKCRLVAMKKKLSLLKKTWPLYNESELLKELKRQLDPEMEAELAHKMNEAPKSVMSQATKRWDLLFEMMEMNNVLINLLWELLVLKNLGGKDLKTPLLEEYRKDVKKKCQRDLEHLRLSSRGNTDVANYLLQRLEEYQFDMSSVSVQLDEIEQCMVQIWNDLGREEQDVPILPDTENVDKVIQKISNVLQEMATGIREAKESNNDKECIHDLEMTIQELQIQLKKEQYKIDVMERKVRVTEDVNRRITEEKQYLQQQHSDIVENNVQLEKKCEKSETIIQKQHEKIRNQQVHMNQLTSANRNSQKENEELKVQMEEMEKYHKEKVDRMMQCFEQSMSAMEERADKNIMGAIGRMERESKLLTEKAVNEVKNTMTNNHYQHQSQHRENMGVKVHHHGGTSTGRSIPENIPKINF